MQLKRVAPDPGANPLDDVQPAEDQRILQLARPIARQANIKCGAHSRRVLPDARQTYRSRSVVVVHSAPSVQPSWRTT